MTLLCLIWESYAKKVIMFLFVNSRWDANQTIPVWHQSAYFLLKTRGMEGQSEQKEHFIILINDLLILINHLLILINHLLMLRNIY